MAEAAVLFARLRQGPSSQRAAGVTAALLSDFGTGAAMRKSRTSPEAIERQMRLAGIMAQRLRGCTFREIGALQGVSTQRAHVLFWRALRSCPFDRARLRRLAARADS